MEKEGSELESIQKELAMLTRTIKSKKSEKSAVDNAKKQMKVLLKHKKQIEANLAILDELSQKLSARHDEVPVDAAHLGPSRRRCTGGDDAGCTICPGGAAPRRTARRIRQH